MQRLLHRVRFWVERLLLRGTVYRLLLFSIVTALVALVAGVAVHLSGAFESLSDATWWAFLRLTDAGYLGSDEGTVRRSISILVTVTGSVLFMGTLMAIMTQWLGETVERLERGETPVRREGHLLVVGWTNRSAAIISELLMSEERTRRILHRNQARRLHVVLLAEDFGPQLQTRIKRDLGSLWDERRLTVRRGDRLVTGDLERVCYLSAAGILLPGEDREETGEADRDTTTIKALVAISHRARERGLPLPPLVAEIFDPRRAEIARDAYEGSAVVLASDQLMGRVLAQAVQNPGLSDVLAELLTHGHGNELYQRGNDGLVGLPFEEACRRHTQGVLMGLLIGPESKPEALLAPAASRVIAAEDRLVVLAPQNDLTGGDAPSDTLGLVTPLQPHRDAQTVVILGWSARVPVVVSELAAVTQLRGATLHIIQAAPQPAPLRRQAMQSALHATTPEAAVSLTLVTGDATLPATMRDIPWSDADRVLIVAGVRAEPGEETDARTIVTELLVRRALRHAEQPPNVLVELTQRSNASLYNQSPTEVVVTPLLVSHVLGQILLRPALSVVFATVLRAGGPTMVLPNAAKQDAATFGALAEEIRARGDVLLGVSQVHERGGLRLNPLEDTRFTFGPGDRLVVLQHPRARPQAS